MGMRVIWTAFGGAVLYIVGAFAVPAVVVSLRNQGVGITPSQAGYATTIGAIWGASIGAYLGWRHARRVEGKRATE